MIENKLLNGDAMRCRKPNGEVRVWLRVALGLLGLIRVVRVGLGDED